MKKEWRGYNLLDLFLISIGIITITVASIIFKSQWYIFLNTIIGLICVFTQAKGKVLTQFAGIIHFSLYIFISYSQALYGESILYLTIMLPMYVYGTIHWLAHRDKEVGKVIVRKNLSKKEWLFASLWLIIVSVGIYFLLKALNTAQLVISTLSFVTMLPAVYLLARRCIWNQVAFLINDLIVPILWIFLAIQGNLNLIPMCIYHIFQLAYDAYGLFEWSKLEKQQNQKSTQ